MKKSGEKYDLGKHVDIIVKISKGTEQNTLNDTGLSDMSEDEILREFVKLDQSLNQANTIPTGKEHKEKLQAVFKIFGTDLSTRSRFISEYTYKGNDIIENKDE